MEAILAMLLERGLSLLGNAVLAKGKDWVEKETGVTLGPEMTSEDMVKLKQYELEHELDLRKLQQEDNRLAVELEKARLADLDSARILQGRALTQEDLFSKRFIYYFALLWSLMVAGYIAAITFWPIPDANVRFADTVLGFMLGTALASVFSFFFGSSRSSQDKDAVIRQAVTSLTKV